MMIRSASGPLGAKPGFDSLYMGYCQKGKSIKILQRELEGLTSLKDSYTRIKDRKIQLLELCEGFSRDLVLLLRFRLRTGTNRE
jgi:hypothetical protein